MNRPRPDQFSPRTASLHKHAHDSGDGEKIYHCPFCGSGQVIARSDRSIECEFCHTSFTVQVQPQFSAFPQTINGQPVQVPGMPGQVGAGGTGAMPGGPAEGGLPTDPGAAPGGDPNAPVDPSQVADDGSAPDDDQDDDSEGGGNPFAKKSLRTRTGALLDEDQYVRHLAIAHAANPREVAARIKASR